MSSFRNAVKRVTHKERAQPQARKRLGLLEKKKDYKLRANDFHSKERRLRALKRKAEMRNPDEFYFAMAKSKTTKGVHVSENDHVEQEVLALIKTQDVNYLQSKRQHELRKIEKLKASLHFITNSIENANEYLLDETNTTTIKKNQHILFVHDDSSSANDDDSDTEDDEEKLMKNNLQDDNDNDDIFNEHNESDDESNDEKEEEEEEESNNDDLDRDLIKSINTLKNKKMRKKEMKKAQEKKYDELKRRIFRYKQLTNAIDHLNSHRELYKKGKRYKVKDAEKGRPAQYKFSNERKR